MTDVTKAETSLKAIEQAAREVGAQYDAHQAAIQDERSAETIILERAIASAKPALRALSSPIRKSERTFWPDNVSTSTEYEDFAERGLVLAGPGLSRDYPRANEGRIEGWRLFLLSDGRLAKVRYDGTWTKWQGASSGWEATMTILTPREAMDRYDLDELLTGLAEHVTKEASREDATKAARARAEHLTALAQLVK